VTPVDELPCTEDGGGRGPKIGACGGKGLTPLDLSPAPSELVAMTPRVEDGINGAVTVISSDVRREEIRDKGSANVWPVLVVLTLSSCGEKREREERCSTVAAMAYPRRH
jgi:hypothetical protein